MPLLENIRKCVTKRHGVQRRSTKIIFNVKIEDSFKSPNIPSRLRDLLVYIARDGVTVTDLFRRPGNPMDMKKITADLEAGRLINWSDYSFYTLANISKRYLLHIEGGVFGPEAERYILDTLDSPDDQSRIEAMHSVIVSQPKPVQQMLALLFGIWFRMIYHTEVNTMSVEAVAKSVAGSVFPSCTTSPQAVERASKVMEYLITGFASADLFSRELIEYFTSETRTSISRLEKFKYEFRFPKDVPREKSVRLFMRLLLEEGKKHGFHLIHNAVTKEVFEDANWGTVRASNCPLINGDNAAVGNEQSNASYPPLPSVHLGPHGMDRSARLHNTKTVQSQVESERVKADGSGALIRTKTSTTLTPTLVRRTEPTFASQSPSVEQMNDAVQQLSEKRTRVTTTPIRSQQVQPLATQTQRTGGSALDQRAPPPIQRFHPLANFRGRPITHDRRFGTEPGRGSGSHKLLARPAEQTPGVCFNSVKRRQLERLQKRSDWFLSPPAGLRATSGLMHLNPSLITNSNATPPSLLDKQSSSGNTTQQTITSQLVNSFTHPVSHSPIPFDSLSSDALYLLEDNGDADGGTTDYAEAIENVNDDDIDRLVGLLDPNGVWSTAAAAAAESRSGPTQRYPPTATSSPKRLDHHPQLTKSKSTPERNEDFPEVETRYYVVERYYGPEVRSETEVLGFPVFANSVTRLPANVPTSMRH